MMRVMFGLWKSVAYRVSITHTITTPHNTDEGIFDDHRNTPTFPAKLSRSRHDGCHWRWRNSRHRADPARRPAAHPAEPRGLQLPASPRFAPQAAAGHDARGLHRPGGHATARCGRADWLL